MLDGLWTAEFGSSTGVFGGGVAVLQDGKFLGGDGGYFYVGKYSVEGATFRATLEIMPFIDNYPSVFRTLHQKFSLELVGSVLGDQRTVTAQARAKEMPDISIGVKLTKRA